MEPLKYNDDMFLRIYEINGVKCVRTPTSWAPPIFLIFIVKHWSYQTRIRFDKREGEVKIPI